MKEIASLDDKENIERKEKVSSLTDCHLKMKKRARLHRKVLHLARSKKSLLE